MIYQTVISINIVYIYLYFGVVHLYTISYISI